MRIFSIWFLALFCLFLIKKSTDAQDLILNEVMSSNQQFLSDDDNDSPDWIELYNAGNSSVNLNDYSLSDRLDAEKAWNFPSFTLDKGKYLVVFASGKDRKDLPLFWNTIISEGDNWKYLVPSNEPSSKWKDLNYNDSSWKEGPSGFGYGDYDDHTILNNIRSVFIRKTFMVSDVSKIEEAFLHMDYDDAFVAYLNGVEIARANITSNGAPAFNAFADNDSHEARMYSGGIPDAFELENIQSVLQNGTNVIAIQVHNGTSTSSDLTAIPFLTLGYSSPVNGTVASFIDLPEKKFHTNFKLSAEGESLFLFKNSSLSDSVRVPELKTNISYGRKAPNGNEWFYYNEPTPEARNKTHGYSGLAGEVTFSVPGGIYTSPFTVSLSSANPTDNIYYTTDDTEPTTADQKYSSPIPISKTTMLRASVINTNNLSGFVSTQSYFFGIKHKLPVISLVTDPDNFFGDENGIYVNGLGHPSSGENCDNGANYWQDWEVPVHVSMIDENGHLDFEQNAGVKIFGGCSRNNPQKSLSIRFRKQYGKDGLHYKVFDDLDIDTFYSLNLRSSGNDWNQTMFRDGLQVNLFPESVDKTAFRPAVVYINGEYWGIHNIRERIDQYYIASHHHVNPDSVNLMEFHVNWLVNLVEGDDQNYLDLLDFIQNNDLADPQNYDYVCSQMDVQNFALYQAAEIAVKNTDWPGNNVKYWQSSDADMLWRWIVFDLDFGFTDVYHNTLTFALADGGTGWPNPAQSTFLLRQLNKNEDFRNLFINAFADELNDLWDEDHLYELIDKMKSDIADEIPRHFARWGGNASSWSSRSNGFYSFASQRPEVVRNFVKNYYNLVGTYTLKLDVNDTDQGTIKINTLHPTSYPWDGIYFKYVPVTLTAIPKQGYRFVGWEGKVTDSNPTIEVLFNRDVELKAVFERVENAGTVVINEVFYNNIVEKSPQDWVEIYNNNAHSVDVSGWKLKDSNDDHVFIIPDNTTIETYNYLVICRDEAQFSNFYSSSKNTTGNMTFGLSSKEDCVRLFNQEDYLIDSLAYSNVEFDSTQSFTYQRFVDQKDVSWENIAGYGTPSARNDNITDIQITESPEAWNNNFIAYPNPFTYQLRMRFSIAEPGKASVRLLNQNGSILLHSEKAFPFKGQQSWELNDLQQLPQGIYSLILQTEKSITSKKVIKF